MSKPLEPFNALVFRLADLIRARMKGKKLSALQTRFVSGLLLVSCT